ncbi:hypothetical protein OE88DRAFT_1647136, partial [Heliocybe sulcata]
MSCSIGQRDKASGDPGLISAMSGPRSVKEYKGEEKSCGPSPSRLPPEPPSCHLYDATAATVPGTNIALRIRNGTPLFRNALGEPAGPLHSMELAGFYDLRLGHFMVIFHPRYNSFIVVATEKGSKNLRSLQPLEKRLLDRFSV